MKEDVGPLPDQVPKKRSHIEALPDLWIAIWLAGDTISPGERKKLAAEKERRKTLHPDVILGVLCAEEGATPEQLRTLREVLPRIAPTEVHQHPLPGKVNFVVKSLGVPVTVHTQRTDPGEVYRSVVRNSTVVVAIQKETTLQALGVRTGVPSAIGLAKHRSTPVRVILPDGTEVK